jgi:hypothetical protein
MSYLRLKKLGIVFDQSQRCIEIDRDKSAAQVILKLKNTGEQSEYLYERHILIGKHMSHQK